MLPNLTATKKNSEIRLCVDFRNLNAISEKVNYPLPNMEHLLQRIMRSAMISMLDGFLDIFHYKFLVRVVHSIFEGFPSYS